MSNTNTSTLEIPKLTLLCITIMAVPTDAKTGYKEGCSDFSRALTQVSELYIFIQGVPKVQIHNLFSSTFSKKTCKNRSIGNTLDAHLLRILSIICRRIRFIGFCNRNINFSLHRKVVTDGSSIIYWEKKF